MSRKKIYDYSKMKSVVKKLMEREGISSDAKLAAIISQKYDVDFSNSTASRVFTGKTPISAEVLCALADYFRVSTDYLLTGTEPQPETEAKEPETLAELIRAVFLLADSSPLDVRSTDTDNAAIGIKLTLDDINRADPSFIYHPVEEEGLDEDGYYNGVSKLFFCHFLTQLHKIKALLSSDTTGAAEEMYRNWKEKMISDASNYRPNCSRIKRDGTRCRTIDLIENRLDGIFDPLGELEHYGIKAKHPESVAEFFSEIHP